MKKATFFEEPRGPPLSVLSLRVTQNAFVLPLLLFLEPFPRIEKRAAAALQPRSSLSASHLPLTFPHFHYSRTITESCVKKRKSKQAFPDFPLVLAKPLQRDGGEAWLSICRLNRRIQK